MNHRPIAVTISLSPGQVVCKIVLPAPPRYAAHLSQCLRGPNLGEQAHVEPCVLAFFSFLYLKK